MRFYGQWQTWTQQPSCVEVVSLYDLDYWKSKNTQLAQVCVAKFETAKRDVLLG